jgi:hypothetical protein
VGGEAIVGAVHYLPYLTPRFPQSQCWAQLGEQQFGRDDTDLASVPLQPPRDALCKEPSRPDLKTE